MGYTGSVCFLLCKGRYWCFWLQVVTCFCCCWVGLVYRWLCFCFLFNVVQLLPFIGGSTTFEYGWLWKMWVPRALSAVGFYFMGGCAIPCRYVYKWFWFMVLESCGLNFPAESFIFGSKGCLDSSGAFFCQASRGVWACFCKDGLHVEIVLKCGALHSFQWVGLKKEFKLVSYIYIYYIIYIAVSFLLSQKCIMLVGSYGPTCLLACCVCC